ncbi:MAG TPA: alkaline phosphatase family protein [Chthoniobacteraceae bacterium]|nr:alkaline phosphatase family protein [Chthoniobacteraceae bacterium]
MKTRRALLCSLDGVRPDALQQVPTPHIDRLVREGACTWKARTVMPSCTLPCHTSMLRGVDTARHGVTSNFFSPLVRPVPSLLEVAHQAGLSTGFSYNWEQLRDLADPGHLDFSFFYKNPAHRNERAKGYLQSEPEQMEHLCRMLASLDLDLFFLYLGGTDAVGHAFGWMSDEYLQAITHADQCLGKVLGELERQGKTQDLCTLVLSDHGGHDRTHGTEMDEDMTIPWILHGPGIRRGHELTGPVRIYDTCVTLAHVLGLPMSDQWEGRVIEEAFC